MNGVCESQGEITTNYTEETPPQEPVAEITTPYQSTAPYQNPFNFIIMIFQLIGIITLLTLLIIIAQGLINSKKKKSKRK